MCAPMMKLKASGVDIIIDPLFSFWFYNNNINFYTNQMTEGEKMIIETVCDPFFHFKYVTFVFFISVSWTIFFWLITLESITIHEICCIDNSANNNNNNCKAWNPLECNKNRSIWDLNCFRSTPLGNLQSLLDETATSFHSFRDIVHLLRFSSFETFFLVHLSLFRLNCAFNSFAPLLSVHVSICVCTLLPHIHWFTTACCYCCSILYCVCVCRYNGLWLIRSQRKREGEREWAKDKA